MNLQPNLRFFSVLNVDSQNSGYFTHEIIEITLVWCDMSQQRSETYSFTDITIQNEN